MPAPGATVFPSPSGSSAIDAPYVISSQNLDLLANSTKGALLSVSNIGSAITSRINSTLSLVETFKEFTSLLLNETALSSLANGAASAAFSVTNTGTSEYVKVVVILGEITPVTGATVQISDGTTAYELAVPTTTSEKRLEFYEIPAAFVASFQVVNLTGVPFASYGNSVVVVGL